MLIIPRWILAAIARQRIDYGTSAVPAGHTEGLAALRLAELDFPDEIPHSFCQRVRNFHLHVVSHALEGLQTRVWHLLGHQMLDF